MKSSLRTNHKRRGDTHRFDPHLPVNGEKPLFSQAILCINAMLNPPKFRKMLGWFINSTPPDLVDYIAFIHLGPRCRISLYDYADTIEYCVTGQLTGCQD
jgi:hypothetical protein